MTVYVDPLNDWGWILRGQKVVNCHMFTDQVDLTELHQMAERIGMRRAWFQVSNSGDPHYDLTESRRDRAIALGAVEVSFDRAVQLWRARRVAAVSKTQT